MKNKINATGAVQEHRKNVRMFAMQMFNLKNENDISVEKYDKAENKKYELELKLKDALLRVEKGEYLTREELDI